MNSGVHFLFLKYHKLYLNYCIRLMKFADCIRAVAVLLSGMKTQIFTC